MSTTQEMTFEYCPGWDTSKKEVHHIIYIEYHGRNVHTVITTEDGYLRDWDFELDCKGIEKYMYHNSGSGGNITELQPPHWADEYKHGSYWIHPTAKFKGKAKNGVRRFKPILYKGDPNPFNNGRRIYGTEYCETCDKYYDEDACPKHHTVNDNGEL